MENSKPGNKNITDALVSRALIWIVLLLFAMLFIWSYFFQLDIASFASGEIVPAGEVKRIQHLEGGIIEEIFVKEGQQVLKDSPLIALMNTAPEANLREVQSRIDSLNIYILRLEAQLRGENTLSKTNAIASDSSEQFIEAELLLKTQMKNRFHKIKAQEEIITQKRVEIKELEMRQSNLKKRLLLLARQIEISEKLLADGIVNEYEHLDLLKEKNTIQGSLLEGEVMLPRLEAALREEETALETIGNLEQGKTLLELEQARKELSEMNQRLKKFVDSQARTMIRSPIDGIVKSIFFVTKGGVVPPGGTVLSIVPGEDELIVKGKLPVGEVGFVSRGQKARITLASAGARGFKPISGEVTYISPDSITEPDIPPYFQVRIKPDQLYFEGSFQKYSLRPGIEVSIAIHTGVQTVLEYLVAPLRNDMHNAFSER